MPTLINLNTVDDAAVLEQALARVFDASSDRRFAATHLLTAIRAMRHDDRRIPNVGELLTARVPVDAIQRAPGLTVYGARLARAQEDSTARKRAAPSTVPLLTASDLAALKPVLVVRTRGEFGRQLAIWVGVYFAAIWLLALFWFLRGVRGDGVLLAAAHFLTAIAFCRWRHDPILCATRCCSPGARTLTAGITLMGIVSLVNFRKAAFLTLSYVPVDRGAGAVCRADSVWQRARPAAA